MKATNIRMTDDLHAAMKALCELNRRSLQAEVTIALENHLAAASKKGTRK